MGKSQFGVKKDVLWDVCDGNQLWLKGSSAMERLGWFHAWAAGVSKEKVGNLGNPQRKLLGDLSLSSHTHHDPDSCSQPAFLARKR